MYRHQFKPYIDSIHEFVEHLKHIIPSWATAFEGIMQKYNCRIKMKQDILRRKTEYQSREQLYLLHSKTLF